MKNQTELQKEIGTTFINLSMRLNQKMALDRVFRLFCKEVEKIINKEVQNRLEDKPE